MAEKEVPNQQNNADEIDLGQLFQIIGNGFRNVFRVFLRGFLYLKKNALILLGLIVVGVAIGYALNQIVTKKLKSEVIVKPQLESKNYLYDVVDEIQANIKSKDTIFFKTIGLTNLDFSGLEVSIVPVDNDKTSTEGDLKYLELLQSFENTDDISDIVRAELQNKSSFNHRITFFYKNVSSGQDFAHKVMNYINANDYFKALTEINLTNIKTRIKENKQLLNQVDQIIANYTNSLGEKNAPKITDRIVLDNKEQVNIADLFSYKSQLIRDIEIKRLELKERQETISIINFGKTQRVQKPFFGKSIVFIPLALIGLFFLMSILKYLNRRATEIA